jgi:ADP-ribose pyrophosphatase YjhB (NUDIX family)
MHKKIPDKLYKKIFSLVPRLTVDIIIKNKKGVVLVKRDIEPSKGKWQTPGGRVFFGESLKHAVKRVAKEETGLNIKIQKFVRVFEIPKKYTQSHDITLVYLAKPVGGKLKDNWQGKPRFFKKLPRNIGFGLRKVLKDVI